MEREIVRRVLIGVMIAVLTALASVPPRAYGQTPPPTVRSVDIVIVLDDSLSMVECWPWDTGYKHTATDCTAIQHPPSDPAHLRYSAARLLVQLAEPDDRIAIIRFDSGVEKIGAGKLVRLADVDRQALINSIQPPSDFSQRLATRIDLAIAAAADVLTTREDTSRPGYILFLTDGKPYDGINNPPAETRLAPKVRQTMERLNAPNVRARVFPVALCNGQECPDAFLKATIGDTLQAHTPNELLQVFSRLFAQMKPNLHVVGRSSAGALEFFVRPAHGAQQVTVVTRKDDFGGFQRDGKAEDSQGALPNDPNITVAVKESSVLDSGKWVPETRGEGSFVVVRTETYPDVVHPPVSIAGSTLAPIYVPKGKPILIAATTRGVAGGTEPLLLNSTTALASLTSDAQLRWVVLPPNSTRFLLQVGTDNRELQIQRSFLMEARDDLPQAEAPVPDCIADKPCAFIVDFPPGPDVQNLAATVYVAEKGDPEKPLYAGQMDCSGRACKDEGFTPREGVAYVVRFLARGTSKGVVFGDWAETVLAMKPGVHVRGLPSPLDLKPQSVNSWPVTVVSSDQRDLHQLAARLELQRGDDQAKAGVLSLGFSVDLRGPGEKQGTVRIEGADKLRPGIYEWKLVFVLDNPPPGDPPDLPAPVRVTARVEAPGFEILQPQVEFPKAKFQPGPNFRVDAQTAVDVQFTGPTSRLNFSEDKGPCSELGVSMESSEALDSGRQRITLRVQSGGPVSPNRCSGTVHLKPQNPDTLMQSSDTIGWQIVITSLSWKLLGATDGNAAQETTTEAEFGDLGAAAQRTQRDFLIETDVEPPFALTLTDAQGDFERNQIDFVPHTPVVLDKQLGRYRIPVDFGLKQPLASNWFKDNWHSGTLLLTINGLPDQTPQQIKYRFRNPSIWHHYVTPWYQANYLHWWPGIIYWPVTFLLLVVLPLLLWIIWVQTRDDDRDEGAGNDSFFEEERQEGDKNQRRNRRGPQRNGGTWVGLKPPPRSPASGARNSVSSPTPQSVKRPKPVSPPTSGSQARSTTSNSPSTGSRPHSNNLPRRGGPKSI